MTMYDRDERFLKTSEVARMLHVSPKTISRWAKEGKIPHLSTLGGHRRYPASEIEKLMVELQTGGVPEPSPARAAEPGSGRISQTG
jgi:excisionase family DNA binding protein